ncbi:hypothetical protein M3Y97_01106000 [Aphelenchoides bicaudatus]|nr:hypothetical protein M3Y97_01106000 [Aphelenchoides bicaudatus]
MWGVFIYEVVIIAQKFFGYTADVSMSVRSKVPRLSNNGFKFPFILL